jgi:dienelactone hydrolase
LSAETVEREARVESTTEDHSSSFWKAARVAAIVITLVIFAASGWLFETGLGNLVEAVMGAALGAVVLIVLTYLAKAIGWLFGHVPHRYLVTLGGVLGAVFFLRETQFLRTVPRTVLEPSRVSLSLPLPLSTVALSVFVLAIATLVGLIVLLKKNNPVKHKPWLLALAGICLVFNVAFVVNLANDGSAPFATPAKTFADNISQPLDLENPADPGPYTVGTLTYGSGVNLQRPEFGPEADLASRTVDASKLLPEWKDSKKRMREWYWGFGLEQAPLNGRVWAPVGDGPFPLVLVVHGNHTMEDYSEAGYAYLGELLASRGFMTVSVDQNYINGTWSGDFQGKEMPARAWLLLEHLRLWRDWHQTADHRFAGKVDLSQIALIGHSRGGEAVAIAASYNQLPFYPDDATVKFDYNFSIRSLVAIAQIDRRYVRRSQLENINFLTLHGSYDSDEPAYHGFRQFNRIRFTDDNYWFKAGIYIHGANHGQFNTGWGREDTNPPNSWLLNLAPLIPAEDQRQVAKVYISVFLETTLKQDDRYMPLFRDVRKGAAWLPDQVYRSQFTDSQFQPIATFEEDLDVTTGTAKGAVLSAEGLTLWREEELLHRDKLKQGTNVAVLGWNRTDEDSSATFTIKLPQPFQDAGLLTGVNLLSFSISSSTEEVPTASSKDDAGSEAQSDKTEGEQEQPTGPNFTIELVDDRGEMSRISFEAGTSIAPLHVQVMKPKDLNKTMYGSTWEPVLQTFEMPLDRFEGANGALDVSRLRAIRFRFDQSIEGVIIIDDIGIRRDPTYFSNKQ